MNHLVWTVILVFQLGWWVYNSKQTTGHNKWTIKKIWYSGNYKKTYRLKDDEKDTTNFKWSTTARSTRNMAKWFIALFILERNFSVGSTVTNSRQTNSMIFVTFILFCTVISTEKIFLNIFLILHEVVNPLTNVQKRDPLFIDKRAFIVFPVADLYSDCLYFYFVLISSPLLSSTKTYCLFSWVWNALVRIEALTISQ